MVKCSAMSPSSPLACPSLRLSPEALDEYQTILCRLPWPGEHSSRLLRTIGLTSCRSGEGVSTAAAWLAVAAALSSNHRVLLVDAHSARAAVHKLFALPPSPGMSEVLADLECLPKALRPSPISNLSLLTAGSLEIAAAQRFRTAEPNDLLEAITAGFDLTVFDLPPALTASFPLRLAGLLDGLLWVVEAERVPIDAALQTKQLLARSGAHVLGTILNKVPRHAPSWLFRTS